MTLRGGPEFVGRLNALKGTFGPVGSTWADNMVALGRPKIPVNTGKTRASLRRGTVTPNRATVIASFVTTFIAEGTRAHTITARGKTLRFEAQGRTVFAKRVHLPRKPGRPFRHQAALEALAKTDILGALVRRWNSR